MSKKITLDENGLISDNDPIYDNLDEYYENDEYGKIVGAVLKIPEERRSAKLRFRLISAYNNLKEFDKARGELEAVFPQCQTSVERAKFHYMFGYINEMLEKVMMARACYEEGLDMDPENESDLDLADKIAECNEYIQRDLDALRKMSEKMVKDIDERCKLSIEKNDMLELSVDEFTMELGFLPGIRKLPGFERSIGFNKFFTVYEGEQKEIARKWFKDYYGVTDKESFIRFYQGSRACNISRMAGDVTAYLGGKPNFDTNELNRNGKRSFFNTVEFIKVFSEFLPEGGILAWDLSEKIGFCRHAFACGILPNSDYCASMIYLRDAAKKNFSSVPEYLRSLVFGSGVYMFSADDWSIKSGMEFMKQMIVLLLNGDLPHVKW